MLSFDWLENGGMVGIDYLQEYLSIKDITQRIFSNLEEGNNSKYALKNYLSYCQQNGVKEIMLYAVNIIISYSRDSDEDLRNLKSGIYGQKLARELRKVFYGMKATELEALSRKYQIDYVVMNKRYHKNKFNDVKTAYENKHYIVYKL